MPRKQKEFKEGLNGRKVWKNATDAVFRNLQGDRKGNATNDPVGAGFSTENLEDFREQALDWLSDHSELASRTLERTDWDEVYAYFKKVREGTL